jgi:hypothetical protein
MSSEIPTLTKRKLQAEVIGPIYAEMVAQIGEERASAILDAAIRKAAIAEGKYFADKAGGQTSMADFVKLYELWTADGALEMKVIRADAEHFDFDITRCRYAETYREMGLGKIGHLLSCNRDILPGLRPVHPSRPQTDHHGWRILLHLPLHAQPGGRAVT